MTDTDTLDRPDTLYITDAELIRRMGVPEKTARMVIRALDADRKSGFPAKDRFFGGRRYWPAVRAYLDKRNRVNVEAPAKRGSP
jgi:hypothetical protein